MHSHSRNNLFTNFKSDVAGIELPKKFTFPFYYEPHPLALIAAKELQEHIINQQDWKHYFGLPNDDSTLQNGVPIGKMFGVLVVKNSKGELGYLCAFSGKLADSNHHPKFVPPVYDMLIEGDFFETGGKEIIAINKKLDQLEVDANYLNALNAYHSTKSENEESVNKSKEALKAAKKIRKGIREKAKLDLNESDYALLHNNQREESLKQQYFHKKLILECNEKTNAALELLNQYQLYIDQLKAERKDKSNALQQRLFTEYKFLNALGKEKSLLEIFKRTILTKPPAGAGECAAPKLLQYAFLNDLEPIALAEFWWGVSPSADIKKHLNFYPACKGKCEPILDHMLSASEIDDNPMLVNPGEGKKIKIIYEDQDLLVINKPAELLSVPGKTITDCVAERMKALYPEATGPLIVHRLDMSTSGIMLIALNKSSHDYLQKQFIKRLIKKRYVALLDGIIKEDKGEIELPLRMDILDRPKQLVCFEHGKPAKTLWQVQKRLNGKTKILFTPITGRTHQLRVHSAHINGLNTPIVGDDLYGTKNTRLHLHAEFIQFEHPSTKEKMKFQVDSDF